MLVLSRKLGERVCIGDDVQIVIVEIGDGRVRIGIDAPRSIPVHRAELLNGKPKPIRTAWCDVPKEEGV